MKDKLLQWLRCPECNAGFKVEDGQYVNSEIKEGILVCKCKRNFMIKDFIPRFVDSDKYVSSFSFEWNTHGKTQLDSANIDNDMRNESRNSFQARVDFPLDQFQGKLVLDVGCGSGRFMEIVADNGAEIIGLDLSRSVDAAFKNLGTRANVHLIQADIFKLPFIDETFDFVYSFGVLHHTPDCRKAFKQLPRFLKKGGKISIFVYSAYNKGVVYSSNLWRKITTFLPKKLLYCISFISIPLYFIYKIPIIGNIGKMVFVIPMWPDWRWRVLDTFDWYSPMYQSKHTHWEVFKWFEEEKLSNIKVMEGEVTILGAKGETIG